MLIYCLMAIRIHHLQMCYNPWKKRVFTTMAATKTFNLAGVQGAYVVIKDAKLRLDYRKTLALTFMNSANMFSQIATKAAYEHGLPWLSELMDYVQGNYQFVEDYLVTHMPEIKPIKPQGTYLLWLNFEKLGFTADERKRWLTEEARVALNHGPSLAKKGNISSG